MSKILCDTISIKYAMFLERDNKRWFFPFRNNSDEVQLLYPFYKQCEEIRSSKTIINDTRILCNTLRTAFEYEKTYDNCILLLPLIEQCKDISKPSITQAIKDSTVVVAESTVNASKIVGKSVASIFGV